MRLDEYRRKLWKEREREELHNSAENELDLSNTGTLSSPFEGPYEEIKIVQEYMNKKNILMIAQAMPHQKKNLYLKGFFKERRNQQVEVYYRIEDEAKWLTGRILTVGRDFVSINVHGERHWLSYLAIEVARVPSGFPESDYSHTNIIYDNDLRQSLLHHFGDTVAKKESLKQIFYEETLKTNLETWRGTNVTVWAKETSFNGKLIAGTEDHVITLQSGKGNIDIPVESISIVKIRSTLSSIKEFFNKYKRGK